MGRSLHKTCSHFRDTFARLEPLYRTALDKELSEVLWSDEAKNLLKETRYGQPANFCLQVCLLEVWRQAFGIQPNIVLGHSVGEFAALVAADVLDIEAAFKLLVARSKLLSTLSPGAMLAVKTSLERVTSEHMPAFHTANPHLWLDVAGNNSHSQVVLSGSSEAIHSFVADNPAVKTTQLDVTTPFHSRATKPILDEFGAFVKEMAEQMRNPTCTYVSGTLARIISSGSELHEEYWRGHCSETVQFSPAIDLLLKRGVKTFIEIGPQPTLLALIRANADPEQPVLLCPSMRKSDVVGWPTLLTSLGRLYEAGVDVTWKNLDAPRSRRIVDLPFYPFQGKDYWIPAPWSNSAQRNTNALSTEVQVHPLLGHRLDLIQVISPVVFRSSLSASSQPWFRNYVTASSVIVPEVVALELMLAVGKELGFQPAHVTDLEVITSLELGRNQVSIQTMVRQEGNCLAVSVFSLQDGVWVEHYKGCIGTTPVPAQDWPELPTVLPPTRTCTAQETYSEIYTRLDAAITLNKLESITAVHELGPNEVVTRVRVSQDWRPRGSRPVVLDAMIQTYTYVNMLRIKKSGGNAKKFATSLGALDSLCWYTGKDLDSRTEFYIHANLNGTEAGEQDYRLRLYTDSGKFLANMDGLVTRHVSDSSQQRSQAPRDFPLFFTEKLEPVKGTLSPMLPIVAERNTWLLMTSNDANTLESALVVELETTGRQVHQIIASTDSEIGHLVPNATWEGMIYVRGHVAGDMDSAEFRKDQETACMGFINLLRLNSSISDGSCRLALVTIGAENNITPGRVDPSGATLTGILATFQNENPNILAVGIDVDPDETDNSISAQQILSSAQTPLKERSVIYRGRQAFTTRLMSIDNVIPGDRTKGLLFKADVSYLVTGGTGGVGLEVAKWILSQGAGQVVLIGRNSQPASTIGLPSDRVTFIAADVSDVTQVRNLLDRFTTQFPPLKGIFHAAGVLADAFIENQNLDTLRRVFDSKVIGTWNLHNLTRHLDLDHFVLFSSISAQLGAVGQSNYAAGNRFMDALVSHRVQDLKLPGLSINWGAWDNLGMAINMSRSGMFAAVPPFPPASGIRGLERAMRLGLHRVVIAEIDAAILRKNLPRMKAYFSKLRSNAIASGTSGPTTTALTFSLTDLATESKTERLEGVKSFLESLVRVHLRIGATEPFDFDRPFRLFGMDSLMEMELRSHLTQAFGLQLDSKLFQMQQTLKALAVYFNDAIFTKASKASGII